MRIALGLLAAALATPVAIAVMFGGLFYFQIGWFAGQDAQLVIDNIRLYALMAAPVALFVTVAAGGPIAHQFAVRGRGGPVRCVILGAILGALPFLLFDGYVMGTNLLLYVNPAPNRDTVLAAVRWAGLGAWCGMWSAAAYWAVAIRQSRRV